MPMCYKIAAEFQQSHGAGVLVHALVRQAQPGVGFGMPYLHAWVELADGSVYDGTLDHCLFDLELYRALQRPIRERRYSAAEAAERMQRTGHYGPGSMTR